MTSPATLDPNIRYTWHSLVSHVPHEPVQSFSFGDKWTRSWTTLVWLELLLRFLREVANQISPGVFDLHRYLIRFLQLGKLIINHYSGCRIHPSERVCACKFLARSIQFARAVYKICIVRPVNTESRDFFFVLTNHA